MQLHKKTIVVTGVASGIGAETARVLRFHGARVIGLDRTVPGLTVDSFVQADLSTPEAIDEALDRLPAQIDGLCNIAGVPGTSPVEIVSRVNYLGLRHLTERLVPRIKEGGAIVNVASILGAEWPMRLDLHKQLGATSSFDDGAQWLQAHPVDQATCYQYFKEALIVWTLTYAQPLFLSKSIRMNCVAPGPVFTPILGDFVSMLGHKRVEKDAHRMKRPAYPDEIAPVIAMLCADETRWINGVNVPVDGGLASTYY